MVRRLPEYLVIWVPLLLSAAHLISFSIWTIWISFTPSTLIPVSGWVGLRNYNAVLASRNWQIAFDNLLLFGSAFVLLSLITGLMLAILLDQRIRGENVLRSIFLYPLAVSFVVTGTVWSWLLNPGIGIQKLVHDLGWTTFRFDWLIDQRIRAENLLRTIYLYPLAVSFVVTGTAWSWLFNPGLGIQKFVRNLGWTDFRFDWITDRDFALYTIVFAAVWHAAGFAMALFLAGLRSIDADLHKAAQIDGAGPARYYLRIAAPMMAPIAISVLVILLQFAIKTFDLVRAMTGGGPGIATMLPAVVVYDFMFQRGQLGRGSAAAVLLLLSLLLVLLPYYAYAQWRARRDRANG